MVFTTYSLVHYVRFGIRWYFEAWVDHAIDGDFAIGAVFSTVPSRGMN